MLLYKISSLKNFLKLSQIAGYFAPFNKGGEGDFPASLLFGVILKITTNILTCLERRA